MFMFIPKLDFVLNREIMRKIGILICSVALIAVSPTFAGQGFQGLGFSVGLENSKYRIPGSEVYNSGADTGYSTSDATLNKMGSVFGVSYGLGSTNFITTVGLDYVNTNANMSTAVNTINDGPITQDLKNRYEAYIAPGYKIMRATLAYLKLGVLDIPNKAPLDANGYSSPTGGPGTVGALYGVGIKQKFSTNSPFFLKLEYTGGQTKNAQNIDSLSSNQYQSKVMFTSASASLGLSF